MATKFNAVFVPVILGIWYILQGKLKFSHKQYENYGIYVVVGISVLCLFWSWIVINPVHHLQMIAQYIGEVGRGLPVMFGGVRYAAGVDVPWWYAPSFVTLQTPPVILFLVVIGIISSIFCRSANMAHVRTIVFVWIGIVFGRYVTPNMIIYNGARHVMEVLPAIALLAMFGIEWLLSICTRWVSKRVTQVICVAVILVALGYPIVRLHPYEALYFNMFAGESKKVSETFDFDYWGFSVGELVAMANSVAKHEHTSVYVEWLNFPKEYFPDNKLAFVQSEAEHADFVIIPNSRNFFDGAIVYWNTHGKVISTVVRDGTVIGYLFATDKNYE